MAKQKVIVSKKLKREDNLYPMNRKDRESIHSDVKFTIESTGLRYWKIQRKLKGKNNCGSETNNE